jgi:immunity protein, SdpI family
MTRAYWIVGIVLAAAALAASAFIYGQLPERIPTHWNLAGKVDGYGPRWTVFELPAMMLGLLGLFRVLPWLSPKGFEVDSFRRTYLFAMVSVLGLAAYVHGVALYATTHDGADPGRVVLGGVSLFFVLLGNVMGKVRRNFYIGIRTPWTLASERVWVDTHRLAGRTMVASGVVGFLLAIVGGWLVPAFAFLIAGVLFPVLYSLVHYKRLERAGQI